MKQTRNILRKGARCLAVCCALAMGVSAQAVSFDDYNGKTVVMAATTSTTMYAVTCEFPESGRMDKQEVKLSNGKIVCLASEDEVKKILWNIRLNSSSKIIIQSVSSGSYLYCTNSTNPNLTTKKNDYFSFNSSHNAFTYTNNDILYGICLFGVTFALQNDSFFSKYPIAKLYFPADHVWRTLNPDYSFGTICLPKAAKASDVAGATFYNISAKLMDGGEFKGIVLEQETGNLAAGRPYIYKKTGDRDDIVAAMSGDDAPVAVAGNYNGLIGDLTGTMENGGFVVPAGMYIIQQDQLWQTTEGTSRMLAGRAYIDPSGIKKEISYSELPQVKGIVLEMEEGLQVGVEATHEDTSAKSVFDLQGRRMTRPQQGRINIIGGRKVIIK